MTRRPVVFSGMPSAIAASACGPLARLDPVPQAQQGDVTVLGLSDIRYWGDEVTPQMTESGLAAYRRERDYASAAGHTGPLPTADYLAISGGGENGEANVSLYGGGYRLV